MPDWRDAKAYEPLLRADRSLFAWEWLRRHPDYRDDAVGALCGGGGGGEQPERWGLHAFECPTLAVPNARPVWRAEHHPDALAVEAGPPNGDDDFHLERLAASSSLVTASDGREHLLISDGLRSIRIDVCAGTLRQGPARLHYRLAGMAAAERPLLTLRRLLAIWRTGRFSATLHPPETRARRFILMLRAHDAVASGATQRQIAAELLGCRAAPHRWRVEEASRRLQVQRLVRGARLAAAGGYLSLLKA